MQNTSIFLQCGSNHLRQKFKTPVVKTAYRPMQNKDLFMERAGAQNMSKRHTVHILNLRVKHCDAYNLLFLPPPPHSWKRKDAWHLTSSNSAISATTNTNSKMYNTLIYCTVFRFVNLKKLLFTRAMDLRSFFVDPDPSVVLNSDSGAALQNCVVPF